MSEEVRKMSAFEAFQQTQISYNEAEEKAKSESGTPKVERFRIGEDGEYPIRILPLAPSFDEKGNILPMERKGYEYPLRQLFLNIKVTDKKGKTKKINVPVIRTVDKGVGYSVDLIDTYVKIACEMYGDDKELIDLINSNAFVGGLKWNYQHAMMVLDVSSKQERSKGPQIFQCSHGQYKDIDSAKMRLWKELREDGDQETCPITSFTGAYPVKIIRKTDKKTEYTVEIGRKTIDIEEEEAQKLLDMPRIPELIYRYTKYQMEATVVFLQQYDEDHDMDVCKEPDFIDAVNTLKSELPADDTSHFDINGVASKSDDGKEETTIDSLWAEYDAIIDQGLNEKSDEYQELREKIRQFIEDNDLDVRISRTKNNQQLLEEIDIALDEKGKEPKKPEPVPEQDVDEEPDSEEVKPVSRPERPSVKPVEEPTDNESVEIGTNTEASDETPRRRARRLR